MRGENKLNRPFYRVESMDIWYLLPRRSEIEKGSERRVEFRKN